MRLYCFFWLRLWPVAAFIAQNLAASCRNFRASRRSASYEIETFDLAYVTDEEARTYARFFIRSFYTPAAVEYEAASPGSATLEPLVAQKLAKLAQYRLGDASTAEECAAAEVLPACIFLASDSGNSSGGVVGCVSLEICLAMPGGGLLTGRDARSAQITASRRPVRYSEAAAPTAVLSDLAVAPSARRRGVGAALCAAVEARAVDLGFESILLIVCADDSAGRARYRRHGFTEGRRVRASTCIAEVPRVARSGSDDDDLRLSKRQVDAIVMRKRLGVGARGGGEPAEATDGSAGASSWAESARAAIRRFPVIPPARSIEEPPARVLAELGQPMLAVALMILWSVLSRDVLRLPSAEAIGRVIAEEAHVTDIEAYLIQDGGARLSGWLPE